MRLIDADKLRYDAELCRETTEAFQALIDEQPTVFKWRDVKDNPPTEICDCIVVSMGETCLAHVSFVHGQAYFCTPDTFESDDLPNVTHWMPLPAPPKEDAEDEQQAEIERLKEKQPRVLTLEEVKQADVVWNEWTSVDGYVESMLFYRIDSDGDLMFAERTGATIYFSPSEYNKSWRCWSARPTAEQMEQTGWDGEQE